MAQNSGILPPHLRKVAFKSADTPAPAADTINAVDNEANGDHPVSDDHRAVIPFNGTRRAARGDRSIAKDNRLQARFQEFLQSTSDETDELHERCDELEAENDALKLRCDDLAEEKKNLLRELVDLDQEKHKVSMRSEVLEAENKQHLAEIQDLKQQMLDNQQRLEDFQRLATFKSPTGTIKKESYADLTSTTGELSTTQLSREQLDDVTKQLQSTYAKIQRDAEEQASIRYKGVMDAQVDMHDKLEQRLTNMEAKFELGDIVDRISALEAQSKSKAPHAADGDYQAKTKMKAMAEELTKLKTFRERMKVIGHNEHEINEAKNLAALAHYCKKVTKAMDSMGWDSGDFPGLTMEDLLALREYAVLRYATFDAQGKAVIDMKARALGGGSPLSDD